MHHIKKFLKAICILLIIALIGFCGYRYYTLKNAGKLKEIFAKDENIINESYYGKDYSQTSSTDSNKNDENDEKESKKEDSSGEKFVVQEKDYEGMYNKLSFDNRLLLYEGTQYNQGVVEAFDLLIADATDLMFSKPTIVFNNFSNLSTKTITENNLSEYEAVLKTAKNELGNNGTCSFNFEYNKLKTNVNKIIITKK